MQHLIGTLNNKINSPVCKMFISSADTRTKSYRIHKHIEFEISLILQGTGIYDTKAGTYDIRPGDIFLYSTNEYHCITDIFERNGIGHMELLNLHFQPSFVWSIGNEYLANSYLKIFQNRLDRDNPAILRLTEQMISIKEEFENKEYDYDICIKTKILELMITIHRNFSITEENSMYIPNQLYERMETALNFMDQNYCSDLSLSDIASKAFMSRTYFCSMFKEMNGLTPWEYINIKRINKAVDLLKSSDLSISSVATQCGYNNMANFSRIFKQITGTTPKHIRNRS